MEARRASLRSTVATLSRVMAFFCLGLMASVWPLWLSSPSDLVQIPWLSLLCGVPVWVDQVALAVLACGSAILLCCPGSPRWRMVGLLCFISALGVLTVLDQHRFQPWVCQFLLLGTLILLTPERICPTLCRILIASLYFWSALSKVDAAFLVSHGQLLLTGLLQPLGIETTYWSPRSRELLTLIFPLGEFAIAAALLFRRSARIGLAASLGMHLLLIWTLGLGLHHEWSVLLWNLYFMVQNFVLLRGLSYNNTPENAGTSQSAHSRPARIQQRIAVGYIALASLYPALELVGYCDHWPAWAVYSARPAQVKVSIQEASRDDLPQELRRYSGQPQPLEDQIPFRLEAWSFQTCGCPVYPQTRYKLALALALLESSIPDDAWNVEIRQTPNRLTGTREAVVLRNAKEVKNYCRRFWGNTRRRLPDGARHNRAP